MAGHALGISARTRHVTMSYECQFFANSYVNYNDPQTVVVQSIFHGSCAAQSHPKIQEDDKLLSVNDRQVADMALEHVRDLIHLSQPGDILALKLIQITGLACR